MASLFKQHSLAMSRVVNATLGEPCVYERQSDGYTISGVYVTINKNKPEYDEFKMLQGYSTEMSVLKEDFDSEPKQYDTFTTDEGEEYTIAGKTIETESKWYFSVSPSG